MAKRQRKGKDNWKKKRLQEYLEKKEQWYEVIEKTVPPKTIDINKKAFDVGYQL